MLRVANANAVKFGFTRNFSEFAACVSPSAGGLCDSSVSEHTSRSAETQADEVYEDELAPVTPRVVCFDRTTALANR